MIRVTKQLFVSAFFTMIVIAACMRTAQAQGSRKDDIVFNAQGRPMAGATVRVCTSGATGQPCAPLAQIYSDAALTQALANPTSTDGVGNYSFYAAPGRYMIEISGPGITTKQVPNVILPSDPSTPTFTSITTTSGISAFSLSLTGNLTVNGSTAVMGSLTVGGAAVPSTSADNQWTASQHFKGPIPHRDISTYGAVNSGVTSTGTISASSTSLSITSAGDWQNGQYISVLGAGPTATVTAPVVAALSISAISRTSNVVTATVSDTSTFYAAKYFIQVAGVSDTSFNGVFVAEASMTGCTMDATTLCWHQTGSDGSSSGGTVAPSVAVLQSTNTGATSHSYTIVSVDKYGGYSAKSTALTVANCPTTLSYLDYVWLFWRPVSGADYYAIYKDGTFLKRSYNNGAVDDGATYPITPNLPSSEPASAGAQWLKTTVAGGGGTTTLTLADASTNAATSTFVIHDSAPALEAAIAAVQADALATSGGRYAFSIPDVYIPYGRYWFSRIGDPTSGYGVKIVNQGTVNLTTHPIMMVSGAVVSWVGRGQATGNVGFANFDQSRVENTSVGSDQVELFVVSGSGGKSIRNVSTPYLKVNAIELSSPDSATNGPNGVLIDNVNIIEDNAGYGSCLVSDGNAIFVDVGSQGRRFSCQASHITSPARPAILMDNVSTNGSFIDWHINYPYFVYGMIYVRSPAPAALFPVNSYVQSTTLQHFRVEGGLSESTYFPAPVMIDSGCSEIQSVGGVSPTDLYFTPADWSDAITPFKGWMYYPRNNISGCTGGGATPGTLINVSGMNTINTDKVGDSVGASGVSLGGNGPLNYYPDSSPAGKTVSGTVVGSQGTLLGNGPTYATWNNGTGNDIPQLAVPLRAPQIGSIIDAGAGGSCSTGTYYFRVTALDGAGGETVGGNVFPFTLGTANHIIQLSYSIGASPFNRFAKNYRVYISTSLDANGNLVSPEYGTTTNFSTYNYQCADGTSASPPTSTKAYSYKLPSLHGYYGWLGGDDSSFRLGIGTSTPGYMLDVATTGNFGTSVTIGGGSALTTSNVPPIYNHSGNAEAAPHMVRDTCTLGTNCNITLTGGAVFSGTTYDCWARDATTPANAVTVTISSASAFAFTGTGTDVISYVCAGH